MTLKDARVHGVTVDLGAIRHNAELLVARASGSSLLADVAADGYGHGAIDVARVALAAGFSHVRVSDASQRDALTAAGIDDGRIVVGRRADDPLDLYGLGTDPAFRAAMTVRSIVVATKTIEAGESVSYGHTWTAGIRTNLALVAIGYADGVARQASNTARIRVGGVDRLIAGRVAMNALVLDLGEDKVGVGDAAIVFGGAGEPSVQSWAESVDCVAAEVTTGFGAHLPRVYA